MLEGASCSCNDPYAKPKREQWRPEVTPFSGPITGTKGVKSTRTKPHHLGDKPLSVSAQEYADRLWRETDASLRLDLAKHGAIQRWSWKSLGALREEEKQRKAESA